MDPVILIQEEIKAKQRIAQAVEQLGDMLGVDVRGSDILNARAMRQHAKSLIQLRAIADSLESLVEDGETQAGPKITVDQIAEVDGVGKKTAQRIVKHLNSK